MCSIRPPRLRRRQRGFTLAELMVIVVIVGVLAAIGISLLRNHVFASRSSEALAMIQSIRAAEERWRAENQTYLDVSRGQIDALYPMASPGKTRYHWVQSGGNDFDRWQLLNPTVSGPVQFGYAVVAGPPGADNLPNLGLADNPTWATPTEPWYVIKAVGDADEDGVQAVFAASSFSSEVYRENEGE
ncbi:MAG TPA: prepilin-type N-terminal cleavage/methylation domain-containing protein [Polyangiaceae bacterium]|nr:prepilin-type N-terminal cleavage/methylation domain-containing protein [Polyangiaceae bacterium]